MAKVPLRTYIREIESLIERGKTDEAIAHCRHILKTFPKHLDTYRMLGKAYLESKRFEDAADIFRRALISVPDDFVSHVGMSIINDDQKRMDETIWHMERAFEVQPSNAAIQAELQRLYGRRDGMEPPKIRLTRGALARMYVQGELYPQAIGEIRSVLAEDPNRVDMQILLALAYFRNGQKVEASESCSQLINRYPYCLEANRILVEILPGTGMAESTQVYRMRVAELDPYASYVTGSIFQTGNVPDNAVMIERLEYKGQPVDVGPTWHTASLGAAPALQPDWAKPAARETPTSPPAAPEPALAAPSSTGEQIPDWMRSAGWGESTGAFDESAASALEEESTGELAKAEIPDWIKSMAPPSVKEATAPASASAASDETMEWLNKLGGETPFDAAQGKPFESAPQEPAPASSGTPDWLADLKAERPPAPAAQEPAAAMELPDWVSELGRPSSETPAPAAPPIEAAPAAAMSAGAGLSSDLGTSADDQDAAMRWLESLAAKQGAKAEELLTNPEERLEKPPEWVEQAKAIGEAQPPSAETKAVPSEAAPPLESLWGDRESTGAFAPASEEPSATDMTSAWLRDLAEKEEATEPRAEQPIWSGEIEVAPPPASAPAAEPTPESELPTWLRGLEEREAAPASSATEEMPDWLKGEEAAEEEEPLPEPTQPTDWTPEVPKVAWPVTPEPPRPVKPPEPARTMEEPAARVEPPIPAKPVKAAPEPRKRIKLEPASEQPVDRTRLKRTGMLPPLVEPALAQARDELAHGKIPDALQTYGALIRKGKLLEDVTFDLKEALYRFPVEVTIWQALGDAYMRANRLQDALDAYTKAEELLR